MTTTPSIETATVEIRTLTVNGRRMSAGYLRQLIEQPLINDAGELAGEPWGYVNQHPDNCRDAPLHLHVVWQAADQLRRSRVNAPADALYAPPTATAYAMARILDGARNHDSDRDFRVYRSQDRPATAAHVRLRHDGVLFGAPVPIPFHRLWDAGLGDEAALRQSADEHNGAPLPSVAELADVLLLCADAYRAAWSALEGLPQLFIGG